MRHALRYLLVLLVGAPVLAGFAVPAGAVSAGAVSAARRDAPVGVAGVVRIVAGLPGRCGAGVPRGGLSGLPVDRPLLGVYAGAGVGGGGISADILAELLTIRLSLHVGVGFLTNVAATACSAFTAGASSAQAVAHPGSVHPGSAHRGGRASTVPPGAGHAVPSAHPAGVAGTSDAGSSGRGSSGLGVLGVAAPRTGSPGSAESRSGVAGAAVRPAAHSGRAPHRVPAADATNAGGAADGDPFRPVYRRQADAEGGVAGPLHANRNPLRNLKVVVIVAIVISAGVGAIFSRSS
jgi:hypothetical protein